MLLIPLINSKITHAEFGILLIFIAILAIINAIDFGIGRTLIKLGSYTFNLDYGINYFIIAVSFSLFFSIIIVFFFLSNSNNILHFLFKNNLNINLTLIVKSLNFVSLVFPVITITNILFSYIELVGNFIFLSLYRSIIQISNYLIPYLVIVIKGFNIQYILVSLMCIRLLILFITIFKLKLLLSNKICRSGIKVNSKQFFIFFRFNKWLLISNIVGQFLSSLDRFIISNLIGLSAVVFFSNSFDLASKILIIPGGLMTVMFPVISKKVFSDREQIHYKLLNNLSFIIFCVCFILIIFSRFILFLWLGKEFSNNSFQIFSTLLLGIFFLSMGNISVGTVQVIGKPKISTVFHLIELPFYYFFLYSGIVAKYGVIAVTSIWSLRCCIDFFLLESYLVKKKNFFNKKIYFHILFFSIILILTWFISIILF